MALYEYHCPENGRTVEVRHGMNERVDTWGELCARTGRDPGATPADAPVERLMSTASVGSPGGAAPPVGGCGTGCACVPN